MRVVNDQNRVRRYLHVSVKEYSPRDFLWRYNLETDPRTRRWYDAQIAFPINSATIARLFPNSINAFSPQIEKTAMTSETLMTSWWVTCWTRVSCWQDPFQEMPQIYISGLAVTCHLSENKTELLEKPNTLYLSDAVIVQSNPNLLCPDLPGPSIHRA